MNKIASLPSVSLQVDRLGCTRAERTVLDQISFSMTPGKLLLLRGANGSGKSTLLMCLAGILPHTGSVKWDLGPTTHDDAPITQSMHFIGHLHAIKPELSLYENLAFWSQIYGGVSTNIDDVLHQAGLENMGHFSAANLSAGQKHRLALARLVFIPRPIWLLDEPSSALDAEGDQWVVDLISAHLNNGGMVIAATHKPIQVDDAANATQLMMGAGA